MDNNSFTRGCSSGGWIEQSTTNSFVFGLVSDRNGVTPINGDRAAASNRGFFKHQRRHRNPRRRQHRGPTTTVAVPLSCSVLQHRRWDGVVSEGMARWQGMQRHSSSLLVSHSLLSVSLSFSISISLFVLASSPAAPWPSIAGAVVHLLPPVSKPVIPFPLAFCVRVFVYRLGLCI
ncbi:hypothetical protein PIB30_067543 [Stylosanthes scabra]|uniref:Transmembrane protein n=1 Tax=Stylosanthes scabra TaxID=79078 RepID=A0ABU6SP70_9FABA|nr:hypothetical protein [Stylosanthes scabra]